MSQPVGAEEAGHGAVTLVVRCDERTYRDTLSLGSELGLPDCSVVTSRR
jgi:hypothetical protein